MAQVTVYVPDRLHQAAKAANINISAATQQRLREVLGIVPPTGPRIRSQPDIPAALVYRCYAKDGELLYIGTTQELRDRFQQHARMTPWWLEVAELEMELLPSLEAAREVERHAVMNEIPRYNIESAPIPHRPHGKGRPPKASLTRNGIVAGDMTVEEARPPTRGREVKPLGSMPGANCYTGHHAGTKKRLLYGSICDACGGKWEL